MREHPYFHLLLHEDEELAALLGTRLASRRTVHEWPLSCVQRLELADGRVYAYKSQRPPTVEGEFYDVARSPLLPRARTLYQGGEHLCLLLDWIDAPRVEQLGLSAPEALALGRELSHQIARIEGRLPYVLDISSEAKWAQAVAETLKEWRNLVQSEAFVETDMGTIARVGEDAQRTSIRRTIRQSPGYVHGDLAGDNVFAAEDGYRVIDWQRPLLGPQDLNMAALLHSLGYNLNEHLSPSLGWLNHFLGLRWLVRCKSRWFPTGQSYDHQVRDLSDVMADLASTMGEQWRRS
jgi:hypothetical protein